MCQPVRGDNQQGLVSGLSSIHGGQTVVYLFYPILSSVNLTQYEIFPVTGKVCNFWQNDIISSEKQGLHIFVNCNPDDTAYMCSLISVLSV